MVLSYSEKLLPIEIIEGKTDFIDISFVNKIEFTIFAPPFNFWEGKIVLFIK